MATNTNGNGRSGIHIGGRRLAGVKGREGPRGTGGPTWSVADLAEQLNIRGAAVVARLEEEIAAQADEVHVERVTVLRRDRAVNRLV